MTYMLAKETPFQTFSSNVTPHHHYIYFGFVWSHLEFLLLRVELLVTAAPSVDPSRDLELQVPNISNVYHETMMS